MARNTTKKPGKNRQVVDFEENHLLVELFGEHDAHLARIEDEINVALISRGNQIFVEGDKDNCKQAVRILTDLYARLEKGLPVGLGDVDGAIRMVRAGRVTSADRETQITTPKRNIMPRSPAQADYIRALKNSEMTFGLGPAGTGKTYLAVAMAVAAMNNGEVERIVLSRPAVEAGERLGFLPGDLREKVDPYLRPLYDGLYDCMPGDQVNKRLDNGEIEVAPLAYMRGRTLANSFVILDEAQNTTSVQMKMFLTRMGDNSRVVVTGDPSQIDLPSGTASGLVEARRILSGVKGIEFVEFSDTDVVRHALVSRIVRAYNADDQKKSRTTKKAPAKKTASKETASKQ
ncbi:MAG: PhoH family protein [Alphaproteobacteria bacterium]|nr:MAG: PhoH family protein [Alphaproteobacteria bacterium]